MGFDSQQYFRRKSTTVRVVTATSNPDTGDFDHPIGTMWANTTTNDVYFLVDKAGSLATWIKGGGDTNVAIQSDYLSGVLDRVAVGAATTTEGNRYIAASTGGGWTAEYVYTYENGAWTEFVPTTGCMCYEEDAAEFQYFVSAAWATFPTAPAASTTVAGIVERATNTEISTGTDDERYITPKGFADNLGVTADASTTVKGISELATDAEAVTGTDTARTIVCSSLTAKMSAPGTIGNTTAAAGTFTDLTAGGTVILNGGTASIGTDNAANAIAIGTGTTARAIGIGDSAAAHVIDIGSTTGAASLSLLAGTGNMDFDGNVATTYTMGNAAQTGTITIGSSSTTSTLELAAGAGASTVNIAKGVGGNTVSVANGINTSAQTINLAGGASAANSTVNILSGNGSAGTQTLNMMSGTRAGVVNIGTGAAAHVTTIGSASGAAQVDILVGTGNFSVEGANSSTYGISTSGADTGTITIGAGTGAQTLNLMTGGTGAKTCNFATGAIGNIVTIGSATAAASLDLLCGTGNFTLEGATASTYEISSTGANTGTCKFASGTGARTVEIAAGGTGVKTINIGTGTTADIITIGTSTGAGSLDLVCGTGNFTLEGGTATTYDISATGVNTGTITIAGGTGAQQIDIATGGTGAKTLNLATGAIGNIVTIGSATAAASLDLLCGTGNFTLEGDVASTYGISATGANTGTISIGTGTGAQTLNLMTGGTGAKTVNIATGAIGNLVTVGSATAAASLDLLCGTGNFTLEGAVGSTYEISSTGANTGTCKFASGTGARTVEIAGGGTGIKTINIGAAATADVITVGTTTGAGTTDILSGSGGITITGGATGAVDMVPVTGGAAGVAATINGRVFVGTFTGQTTAAAATIDITITNSAVTAGCGIFCTVSNKGTNDADITLEGCITQTAGTLICRCQNNGSQALNGDVIVTGWVIN